MMIHVFWIASFLAVTGLPVVSRHCDIYSVSRHCDVYSVSRHCDVYSLSRHCEERSDEAIP
jgi:hypothetical protein